MGWWLSRRVSIEVGVIVVQLGDIGVVVSAMVGDVLTTVVL